MFTKVYQVSYQGLFEYGKRDIIIGYFSTEDKAVAAIRHLTNENSLYNKTGFVIEQKNFIDGVKDIPLDIIEG